MNLAIINWKTAITGVTTIAASVGALIHDIQIKNYGNLSIEIAGIATGVGLIFAKDKDVTGGSKMQPSSVEAVLAKVEETNTIVDTTRK